jgi:hypothetical protein
MEVNISNECCASLIKGLYESERGIHPHLIPIIVYYNIAQALSKDEKEIEMFDEWVRTKLEIAPKEAFTDIRLKDCQDNGFYLETESGDVTLIALGDW